MALIKFHATTVWNAFLLNALAIALATGLTIGIKDALDKSSYFDDKASLKIFISILSAFLITLISYISLHFIFGFGGGMLSDS